MKNHPAIKTVIDGSKAVYMTPRLVVEWNMNRYVIRNADNDPLESEEGYEFELFPIDSIVEPLRPTKGINKARIESGVAANDEVFRNYGVGGRFYVADEDDVYKYWTSPYLSNSTGDITGCNPNVVYDQLVAVNKIVITTENTWATMKTFNIQVTTDADPIAGGGTWTTVATQADLGDTWKGMGQITLWWNGTNWLGTQRNDNTDKSPKTTNIKGVRLVVTALESGYRKTKPGVTLEKTTYGKYDPATKTRTEIETNGRNAHFDLIEISARLEADLSDYVVDVSTTMDMGADQRESPMGTVTTNQASITMSNLYRDANGDWQPGLFNADNNKTNYPDSYSPYAHLVDANNVVKLFYTYTDEDGAPLGEVQEFVMYSDIWAGQGEDQVTLECSDYSKFFNHEDAKCPAAMWEGLTVTQIAQRILDSVGFVDYNIEKNDDVVTDHIIPVFFADGETNVWEVMQELSEASLTAIYFDSYGVLQFKTRGFAFLETTQPTYKFVSDNSLTGSGILPNIKSTTVSTEYEPNYFKVSYSKSNWGKVTRGQPALEQVWQPEQQNVVLRASPLKNDLGKTDDTIVLNPKDAEIWPYEGMMNVEGEIIRYEGKVYKYFTGSSGNTENYKVIKNQEQYKNRDKDTLPQYRGKNLFTGGLKITERGAWNSEAAAHTNKSFDYNVRHILGVVSQPAQTKVWFPSTYQEGRTKMVRTSRYTLASPPIAKNNKYIAMATLGNENDQPFYNYGTRFRFLNQKGRIHQMGGLVIHNSGAQEDGYYLEFQPSKLVDAATQKGDGKGKPKGKKAPKKKPRKKGGKPRRVISRVENHNPGISGKVKAAANPAEFVLYKRQSGKMTVISKSRAAIAEGIDYELDVEVKLTGDGSANSPFVTRMRIWLNGKMIIDNAIRGADLVSRTGKWGMYIRGRTRMEYEYLYGLRRPEEPDLSEDYSFLDKVQRGYMGKQWDRNWVYDWRNGRKRVKTSKVKIKTENGAIVAETFKWKKVTRRFNRFFFDEMGSIAHEIREFDVKFEPAPVQFSKLYCSNDWAAAILEYIPTNSGAKFIVANTSRKNAVIHGEDKLSFSGSGGSINQVLTVFGRTLNIEEAEDVTTKNDESILRRGKIEAEVGGKWLQSRAMAKDVADWLKANFSYGNDNITIDVFGNPLIEIGDVVNVNDPDRHVKGDYFVISISNSFSEGFTTSLTLRKRRFTHSV